MHIDIDESKSTTISILHRKVREREREGGRDITQVEIVGCPRLVFQFCWLRRAAAAMEAEMPAGWVVRSGSFLISAPATPSASFLVASLSDGNFKAASCYHKNAPLQELLKGQFVSWEKKISVHSILTVKTSTSLALSASEAILALRIAADWAVAATPPGMMVVRPVALTSAAWIAAASLLSTGFWPAVSAAASRASPMVIASRPPSSSSTCESQH